MLRRTLAIATTALALTATVSACGSSKSGTTNASTSSKSSSSPAPAPSESNSAAAAALFGPSCASLGLTAAALTPAAAAPVGTVAANVPFLSDVVAAANAAGLTDTLNAAPALTVFAPVDDAFKKEPPAQVQALLTDPSQKPALIATLKYHVVAGEIGKADLVGKHTTLQGTDLTVAGSGDDYTVNGTAKILCGGIQTKNAVVYLIDSVLHPAS
jgi:uncharacterized surface protein with fasciclin (FAS1) repeats